jgi:1-acyl-sn-glycerol-3-phosphate acyltransferase
MLRSLLVLLFLPPYVLAGSLIGYPIARLFGSPRLLYVLARVGVRIGFLLSGTRVKIEGLERLLADHRNVVVMPNHSSNLDGPLLFGFIPIDFKAVFKRELTRIPFFSYCLRYAGLIDVDRSQPEDAKRAIQRAVTSLRSGTCFIVFPEGTRSRDGQLGEFKKGGFVIAIEARSRIVPVAILGARPLLPRGRFAIRPGTVRVRVLDPIDAAAYSYEERERLVALVQGRIAAALAA